MSIKQTESQPTPHKPDDLTAIADAVREDRTAADAARALIDRGDKLRAAREAALTNGRDTAHTESVDRLAARARRRRQRVAKGVGKALVTTGLLVAAAGVVTHPHEVGAFINKLDTHGDTAPETNGDFDPSISTVVIEDGARLRDESFVGSENNPNHVSTVRTEDGTTPVAVDGVFVRKDSANGEWYGIEVDDLISAGIDLSGITVEDGSVLWVNSQKADAESGSN